jgi:hypothetical protein
MSKLGNGKILHVLSSIRGPKLHAVELSKASIFCSKASEEK